jgi:hypothetical protein
MMFGDFEEIASERRRKLKEAEAAQERRIRKVKSELERSCGQGKTNYDFVHF